MQKGDLVRLTEQDGWTATWRRAVPVGTTLRIRSIDLEYSEAMMEPIIPELGAHWPNGPTSPSVILTFDQFEVL